MSYKKQNFADGQKLSAKQLNHIEDYLEKLSWDELGLKQNENFPILTWDGDITGKVTVDITIDTPMGAIPCKYVKISELIEGYEPTHCLMKVPGHTAELYEFNGRSGVGGVDYFDKYLIYLDPLKTLISPLVIIGQNSVNNPGGAEGGIYPETGIYVVYTILEEGDDGKVFVPSVYVAKEVRLITPSLLCGVVLEKKLGAAGGVATLDWSGKIPTEQLPIDLISRIEALEAAIN